MSNKKVLIKAVKELNKAKAPAKQKDIVTDPMGQWKYPGQVTRIPSDVITMQGVDYPVWAQPSVGPGTMMMPGQDYDFPGADYVDEYPQMRKGGMLKLPKMPKPSKKGVLGKAYSKSLDATNRLFTENKLFEKPKSKKRKIFDPNAKYQDGGATSPEEWGEEIRAIEEQIGSPDQWSLEGYNLLQNKLNQYRDWRENTPEGQAVMDSHNVEGEYNVPVPEHLQDYTNAMMKSRLAYANEFGNPAAKRMITIPDNPYQFEDGNTGTHYMASMDEYAVPQIQDENGTLMLKDYGPDSNEAIRFDNPDDAQYFAEHYKEVSPGFIEAELTPEEIQSYRDGGYVVEDISVPELTQAQKGITISDPKEYARRKAAYNDSLALHNKSIKDLKGMSNTKFIKAGKYTDQAPLAGWSQGYIDSKKDDLGNTVKGKIKPTGINYSTRNSNNEDVVSFMYKKPVQPVYFAKPKPNSFSPIYVTNPLDPRLTAYDDSLRLYNNYATADANFKKRGDKKNAVTKPGRPGEYEYVHKEISPNVIVSQSEKNPDFHPTIKPTGRVSYDLKKPRVYKNGTLNGVPYEGLTETRDYINVFKKPVQPVYFKAQTDPEGKMKIGEREVSTLDEKTGKIIKVIEPIYEDIKKLPLRSINFLPQNTELAKIPVKSTPQKRNFVASGPRKTFSTMEWDANKQDFVETKRANRSTKVGDTSASQEYLVDGKPISAEKLAELNAISARAKQRPQLTPAQMEEMQLMSTQFAYGGNIYQGGGQLGSGMLAQQIRQSKNAPKKPLAVDNPRLGPTKQSNQGNTATITPNNKLPQTLNTVRNPEAERKELDRAVRELVQSGAASRSLETLGSSDKSLYQQTQDALLTDPDFYNKVNTNEYNHQQELEQKAYDDASYLQRGVNLGTAFLSNPITTGANLLEGYRPLMNQAEVLRDPNNPQNVLMRNTGGLDDIFNVFNPGSYVANYNSDVKRGDYAAAALDAADILLAPTSLGLLGDARDASSAIKAVSKNINKKSLKTLPKITNAAESLKIVSPPGIPKKPFPDPERLVLEFNQLQKELGFAPLEARARMADEYGRDVLAVIDNPSGGIPENLLKEPTRRDLSQNNLENIRRRLNSEFRTAELNLEHPQYQLPTVSYDEFIRKAPSDIVEELSADSNLRNRYELLRSKQSNASSLPAYMRRNITNFMAKPNINTGSSIRHQLDFNDLYDDAPTVNNNVNYMSAADITRNFRRPDKIGKKFKSIKNTLTSTLSSIDEGIGKIIDKSKIESLKKPIKPADIEDDVNKLLNTGLGIKKGDVKIKVVTKPNGEVQVLLNTYEYFKKNKKLIEDTYGEGSYDNWMQSMDKDTWINSGKLNLGSTFGEEVSPRKFTEILRGKPLEQSTRFGIGRDLTLPAPGLKRSGDFPFANWSPDFRENILDNLGISGELTQAYKKAAQNKGYEIYSGGTGHLQPGAKRYVRELLNDRVEIMNSKDAEHLFELLNNEAIMAEVNKSLKNKNVPLPSSVQSAIQPLIFKYKRKGGAIEDNYFDTELTPEEIEEYKAKGYIVEELY